MPIAFPAIPFAVMLVGVGGGGAILFGIGA
jgi:hypothetical protein